MLKSSYELEVLVNGKPAKECDHQGRVYIEGREGTRFSIRMKNNSYSRKLFVPTIDGLSIMNGEEGSFESSGYIVQGYSAVTIDGWRTSDKEVAEFFFSSPEGSYRKKMKRGDNLGVIGCAVFTEKEKPLPPTVVISGCGGHHCHSTWCGWCYRYHCPHDTCSYHSIYNGLQSWNLNLTNTQGSGTGFTSGTGYTTGANSVNADYSVKAGGSTGQHMYSMQASNTSANMVSAKMDVQQQLGTGFGDSKHSEVTTVTFDRSASPDTVFEILYNTHQELEKLGINFQKAPLYVAPQAFPGQYCKPPEAN